MLLSRIFEGYKGASGFDAKSEYSWVVIGREPKGGFQDSNSAKRENSLAIKVSGASCKIPEMRSAR